MNLNHPKLYNFLTQVVFLREPSGVVVNRSFFAGFDSVFTSTAAAIHLRVLAF